MCYDSETFWILEIGPVEIMLHNKMLEAYTRFSQWPQYRDQTLLRIESYQFEDAFCLWKFYKFVQIMREIRKA